MTFIEAAIEVLREAGKPLSAEELTALVVERNLLSKPGANPLRSMKGRLTAELNKGAESRLQQVDEAWALANGKSAGKTKLKAKADAKADASSKAKAKAKKPAAAKESKTAARGAAKSVKAPTKTAAKATKKAPAKKGKKAAASDAETLAETPEVEAISETPTQESQAVPEPKVELSPEEAEFAEIYGEAPADTVGVAELTEYRDEKTADEDREMVPEMVAERRGRRGDRDRDRDRDRRGRRERKRRRDRSGDPDRRDQSQRAASGAEALVPADTRTALEPVPHERALEPVAPSPLALVDKAASVLRSIPDARGVPLAQLAQMMRKRRLLAQPVELALPALRSALRFDERWSHRRGLRPTITHLGRDRYGLDGSSLADGRVRAAEERFRAALMELEAATKARLGAVLGGLELDALERVVQLHLEQSGYSDLQWIKRAGRSSYATAEGPNGPLLIGARVGPEPVDRRGVGELRVGVQAKDLPSGLLICPTELSEDAQLEWEKGGKPVSLLCGAALVEALSASGVGVRWLSAPVPYLDDGLLAAIDR